MITKELFVQYMESIEKQNRKLDEAVNALEDMGIGCIDFLCDIANLTLPTTLLAAAMGKDEIADEIAYFMFECNSDFTLYSDRITIDGNPIDIKSYEDMYDFFMEYM